jgi:hypothetical protein
MIEHVCMSSCNVQYIICTHVNIYVLSVNLKVLTGVVLKRCIFWDITPRSLVERQPTIQSNMSPSSSGLKIKLCRKPAVVAICFVLISYCVCSSSMKM